MQTTTILSLLLCLLMVNEAVARRSLRNGRACLSAGCQAHYDRHRKIQQEFMRKSTLKATTDLSHVYVRSGSRWNLASPNHNFNSAVTRTIASIRSKLPIVAIRVSGNTVSYAVSNNGRAEFQQYGARCLRTTVNSGLKRRRSLRQRRTRRLIRELRRELGMTNLRNGVVYQVSLYSNTVNYGFTPQYPQFMGILCPKDRFYNAALAGIVKNAQVRFRSAPIVIYDKSVYVPIRNSSSGKMDFYFFGAIGGSGLPGARCLRGSQSERTLRTTEKISEIRQLLKELATEYESN